MPEPSAEQPKGVSSASAKWQNRAKGILRVEIARSDISHREILRRLAEMGLKESEPGLSNKLARGSFSAAYMLAILSAIGCKTVRVEDDA